MEAYIMDLQQNIGEYLDYCKFRKELDFNTLKAYRIDLRQFFEFAGKGMPNRRIIEAYITELHKKYRQKTVKRKIASLKAFYTYLEEQELITESPMRRIRTRFKEERILPRIIPRREIEKLLNVMYRQLKSGKGKKTILRDLAVVEMFFATGARVYEVANIKIENMDLSSGIICFMGKGGKERVIQIGSREVTVLLRQYYTENKEVIRRCGYFFVNQNGNRFSEQSIRRMLKQYTKSAGIERNITPHGRVIIRTS